MLASEMGPMLLIFIFTSTLVGAPGIIFIKIKVVYYIKDNEITLKFGINAYVGIQLM